MGEQSLTDRMERLESAHAFSEHTTDQLDAELRKAFDAIAHLEQRLAKLEQRLTDVETGDEPED